MSEKKELQHTDMYVHFEEDNNLTEMYVIIEGNVQLERLQKQGWIMPEWIVNLGVGCIIKITREKRDESD